MKKDFIKNTLNMIFYNFKTFLLFEYLFKVLISCILLPIGVSTFHLLMDTTGFHYITAENVGAFIFNPITISVLLLVLFFLAIYTIFDISTMIVIFDESYHKNKITLRKAMKISFAKCKNIFHFKNILVCFLVFFLIPFLNIGVESGIYTTIQVPTFITEYILYNRELFIIYFVSLYFLNGYFLFII